MDLPEDAGLLRIFVGEADRHDGRPLYEAIVLEARERGLAGATVLRGMLSFGRSSRLHTTKVLRLSDDLPIVIEIVDREENLETPARGSTGRARRPGHARARAREALLRDQRAVARVSTWLAWLLVALGGAAGTLLRFVLGGWMQHAIGRHVPVGDVRHQRRWGRSPLARSPPTPIAVARCRPRWRIALQVGVLGGFTTFSSFGLETFRLVQDGDWPRATGTCGRRTRSGSAAVWIGYRVIERI